MYDGIIRGLTYTDNSRGLPLQVQKYFRYGISHWR